MRGHVERDRRVERELIERAVCERMRGHVERDMRVVLKLRLLKWSVLERVWRDVCGVLRFLHWNRQWTSADGLCLH